MNYWLSDNRDMAEKDTLNMLIGRLEAMRKHGIRETPDDTLKYIRETIAEEEKRLNERFPKKAR